MSDRRYLSVGSVLAVLAIAALGTVWRVEHMITSSAQAAVRVSTLLAAREALQLRLLSACAGLEWSFDDVNTALRALHELDSEAVADTRAQALTSGTNELAQAARALRAEDTAIEMFKTDLSLLRLSSQHFPVAVDGMMRRTAPPDPADHEGMPDRDAALREATSALRTDLERYQAAPTREGAKRLEAAIATLSGLRAGLAAEDEATRADLTVILGHSRAILERRERVDSFARGFEHSPVRQHLEAARVAYERSARARVGLLATARLAASMLAALGLLAIGIAVWRARQYPADSLMSSVNSAPTR